MEKETIKLKMSDVYKETIKLKMSDVYKQFKLPRKFTQIELIIDEDVVIKWEEKNGNN